MHAATSSTSSTESASTSSSSTRARYLAIAAAASVLHAVVMIPSYAEGESFQVGEFAVILGLSLVVSVALFLLVVPRGGAVTAVVLGSLAVVSVAVFWALVTGPLAAAAATVAVRQRAHAEQRTLSTVGLVLAGLAVVGLVAAVLTDGVS